MKRPSRPSTYFWWDPFHFHLIPLYINDVSLNFNQFHDISMEIPFNFIRFCWICRILFSSIIFHKIQLDCFGFLSIEGVVLYWILFWKSLVCDVAKCMQHLHHYIHRFSTLIRFNRLHPVLFRPGPINSL